MLFSVMLLLGPVQADQHNIEAISGQILELLDLQHSPRHKIRRAERQQQSLPLAAAAHAEPLIVESSTGTYPVIIETQAGAWMAKTITTTCPDAKYFVIADTTVANLHATPLLNDLKELKAQAQLLTIPPGESSKSWQQAALLYDQLSKLGATRQDAIIALGGGVTGDLAGFVASTYMRGIDCIQIPTTSLAVLDSSVGGKTAVNTAHGKNLVGTFHPPKAVCIALSHLRTLPARAWLAGLVEAIKMAATHHKSLFYTMANHTTELSQNDPDMITQVIHTSLTIKSKIVAADEHENNERAKLNFGHTVGHAIEKGEHYRILHGEAVGLGMLAEAEWAEKKQLSQNIYQPLKQILSSLGLPTDWRRSKIDFRALETDKKRLNDKLLLPIVSTMGQCDMKAFDWTELRDFLLHNE